MVTLGNDARRVSLEEAAMLAAVNQGGLMELRQVAEAMGELEASGVRAIYRRLRRLRGVPSDRGMTEKRVRQSERMREEFRCPVCGKGGVAKVSRSWAPQWGSAQFRYHHAKQGEDGAEETKCAGPRMTTAEAKRLKREEDKSAAVTPEKELVETEGMRLSGSQKVVYGITEDGVESLGAWYRETGIVFPLEPATRSGGWQSMEHSLLTSEVYVKSLVAAGCAGRPWAFRVGWKVEPGALKWVPLVRTPEGKIEEGSPRYVKPDVTMLVPAKGTPGLERGRRVFIEVERGTQNLTDPSMENAGAVESKVKRYESFCCYGRQAEARSYYRANFPDDTAEPWLLVVATEKRKKAIVKALGERESMSEAGFHGFRVRVVSFEEVGEVVTALAGGKVAPGPELPAGKAPRRKAGEAADVVKFTLEEAGVLGTGVLEMRKLYERLRERVKAANKAQGKNWTPIEVEATPAAWTSGARPLVERLLQETMEAAAKQKGEAKAPSAPQKASA